MKSNKCVLLLCLLVSTASAAPGIIGKVHQAISGSPSDAHSVGANINIGHLNLGANLNTAHSHSKSSASNIDNRYRRQVTNNGATEADASATSQTLTGDVGLIGFESNLNSKNGFTGVHAGASSISHTITGTNGFIGGINNAQTFVGTVNPMFVHGVGFGMTTLDGAIINYHPFVFGGNVAQSNAEANTDSRPKREIFGSHAEASASSQANSFGGGLGFGPFGFGGNFNSAHSHAQANANTVNNNYSPLLRPSYFPHYW